MTVTNDYVPFCGTDTGTNLLSQAAYLSDPQLAIGNQTGVARSVLVNKVLRQASFVAANLAQLVANSTQTNTNDNNNSTEFLAQLNATLSPIAPWCDSLVSPGSGTYNLRYVFFTGSCNATVGATYTNNSFTFTVMATVAAGTQVVLSGTGAPSTSGTLTNSSGTGDSSITFYAVRFPLVLRIKLIGGGGGGGGNGQAGSGGTGGTGGTTSFGSSLLTALGGTGGAEGSSGLGGLGGSATVSVPAQSLAVIGGGSGQSGSTTSSTSVANLAGGMGAASPFGGAGGGGSFGLGFGSSASVNSGSGGGGAATENVSGTAGCGAGGGSGGYIEASLPYPSASYPYIVAALGAGGTAGTSGSAGGDGGTGMIAMESHYQ